MKWRFDDIGWRFFPGGLAALGFVALLRLGVLQPLEEVAYNAKFRLRGEKTWDERIVLVKIDDDTLKKLGRFPFSRKYYSQLIDRLTDAGATVIAIDVLFSEISPDDRSLAAAIARSQRVILAQDTKPVGPPLLPVPMLQGASIGSGHIRVVADSDGVVRRIEPLVRGNLAFGAAVVEAYSFLRQGIPQPKLNRQISLNWTGSVQQISQYSFADVVRGTIQPQALRDKIVLIGVTATGFDVARTPFDLNPPASGVHLQATLIHNLLRQNALQEIHYDWLWLLLLGPVLGVGLSCCRTEMQAAIALTLTVSWGGIGLGLLTLGYLLPVAFPISLIVITTILSALTERLRMNAMLQRQLRYLWQNYQSDLVLHPVKASDMTLQNGYLPSMQRITQITALAEQFGRSQSAQAAIARSLSIGLVAADFDGLVWFCNPSASKLLALEPGTRLKSILVPDWIPAQEWTRSLDILQTGMTAPTHEKLMNQHWYSLHLEPLSYQTEQQLNFKLDGILLLIEEISNRKKVEASLDQRIEQSNQLKDDFLSTVSHELITPLTNIKMAVQLLKTAKSEKHQQQYLQILERECNREMELINELLDLQRLNAGQLELNPERIQLQSWLPDVITPFYQRTGARQQSLSVAIAEDMPALVCDRTSLERIMAELVNNACKYTPPDGEILVMADDIDSQVELRVSNSGSEIPEEAQSRIFERFYRVPDADFSKQGGTGLGLALVKKLVESLDGEIQVESLDGWTTFTVQLPLK